MLVVRSTIDGMQPSRDIDGQKNRGLGIAGQKTTTRVEAAVSLGCSALQPLRIDVGCQGGAHPASSGFVFAVLPSIPHFLRINDAARGEAARQRNR